jgi:hypothetical protein
MTSVKVPPGKFVPKDNLNFMPPYAKAKDEKYSAVKKVKAIFRVQTLRGTL